VLGVGIPPDEYTKNPNIILFVPSHGNHNGFYQGSSFEIFSNTESYRYPAHIATAFIEKCLERRNQEAAKAVTFAKKTSNERDFYPERVEYSSVSEQEEGKCGEGKKYEVEYMFEEYFL
jgi:hypothetical protein